jgi:hypothetical protein
MITFVVISYGAFYYLNSKRPGADRKVANTEVKKAINVDDVVNKYIKQTADQMARDQLNSQIILRQELQKPLLLKKPTATTEVNPEDIPADQQIWKDSQTSGNSPKSYEKESAEKIKQLDEQDKKEYARQYIENARKDGYHVVLSPDLKVLSVTPIRRPSQSSDSVESFPEQ